MNDTEYKTTTVSLKRLNSNIKSIPSTNPPSESNKPGGLT